MQDRTPQYPGRIRLVPVPGQDNVYDMTRADSPIADGTPINKQTLLTDETAYLLELKTEDPTPNDAFTHIAKNFVGDGGMNINLLEEMIHMKYCKILETEQSSLHPWLGAGALKCVVDSYNGAYRYYARVVAETAAFEVRREKKTTGEITNYSIPMSTTLTYSRSSSVTTYWVGRIVPVPVRHSDHMIFMYHGGYYYSSTYKGVLGTICFDTTADRLVAIGQTSTTSSALEDGAGYYNYLNCNGYQGSILANAVRTDSGFIRFWCGYNESYSGYIYGMEEGGTAFSSYSSYRSTSMDDYTTYPYYVALYKNDYAHITGRTNQYHVQFTTANTATLLTTYAISGVTYYSSVYSISGSDASGGYTRSLTYSEDGLTSYFTFHYKSSPYTICRWTNTSLVAAPTYSVVDSNSQEERQYWTISRPTLWIVSSGSTLLTDQDSGQYLQSMTFAAKPAQSCYNDNYAITATATAPAVYQMTNSAGYILNHTGDGIIAWNQYGQVLDLRFYEQDTPVYQSWTCPEDGTYKILLVGGGAAGGATYGGGAGYLQIATVPLLEGDTVSYQVGKGGIYNQTVPANAQVTQFGELQAMPGSGRMGGADGASTPSGGGGGGYNLVTYGGQGQNYSETTTTVFPDRNGGQSLNSGACTAGDGYGAGGGYLQNGKDGVIVILR